MTVENFQWSWFPSLLSVTLLQRNNLGYPPRVTCLGSLCSSGQNAFCPGGFIFKLIQEDLNSFLDFPSFPSFSQINKYSQLKINSKLKVQKCDITGKNDFKWKSKSVSYSVMSNSLWPHGLLPARLLCPWDSPGKSTEWVAISFSKGSSLPRDWTPSPALQVDSLLSDPPGKPRNAISQDKMISKLTLNTW